MAVWHHQLDGRGFGSRGEAKDSALLSSRDAGLLEPPALTHLGSPLLCISVVYSISLLSSIHCTEGLQFGGHLDFGEPRGGMKLS